MAFAINGVHGAQQEAERRYNAAGCEASNSCRTARAAGGVIATVGLGGAAIRGGFALARYCLANPLVCNTLGIEASGLIAGDALPTRAGTAGNFDRIVAQLPGKMVAKADALNPGVLGNTIDSFAATFSGGKYATVELSQDVVLYRAWTPGQSKEFGSFWALEKPAGSLQARIDSALLPEWGNIKGTNFSAQATEYTAIRVPAGTRIYVGEVGSQGGPWVGGKSQLLIEGGPQRSWKIGEGKLK